MTDGAPKLWLVVSAPFTAKMFLTGHIEANAGKFDVTVVANWCQSSLDLGNGRSVKSVAVAIERRIAPAKDVRALIRLWWLLRSRHVGIVHSFTPKAGLLTMVAGLLARTRHRVHTFTGQVWSTKKGFTRSVLKACDRIIVSAATHILVDSQSQLDFLVRERVLGPAKATVIANGSLNGVDAKRFRPDEARRLRVRTTLRIPEEEIVVLYVGRLKVDKGVLDLAEAFLRLIQTGPPATLVVVGPDEDGLSPAILDTFRSCPGRLRLIGPTDSPEDFMAGADIFCLPSYREGFGSVIIEAGASGLPTIAARIYGVVDATVESETGLLYEPGNVDELLRCLSRLAGDKALRRAMAEQGRLRAVARFDSAAVTGFMASYYSQLTQQSPGGASETT